MTKAEIINHISKSTGINKSDAQIVIDAFCETIRNSLEKGDDVYLRKFGSFFNKKKAPKIARNIHKNTSIFIEAHYSPYFKPSKLFIDRIKLSNDLKKKL